MGCDSINAVQKNFLGALNSLTNHKIDTKELEKIISSQIINSKDLHQIYKEYIESILTSNPLNKELGSTINRGLTDNFLKLILEDIYGEKLSFDSFPTESVIISILIDIIGQEESIIYFLTKQDLIIERLNLIPYKKSTLLKYLKRQIEKISSYKFLSEEKISHSVNVVNCCEALSDCKNKIVEKGKVYEKKS